MKDIIRRDILNTLSRVIDILEEKEEKDYLELKNLSNMTLNNSSIFQDEDSISVTVMVYAFAKLIDRGISERTYDMLFTKLVTARDFIQKNDQNNYRKIVTEIFDVISRTDEKLKLYVGDVIKQARMKKAGRIYEQGLSVGIISEIMGVSQWDLLNYLGSTSVVPEKYDPKNIRKRLNFARELFNI